MHTACPCPLPLVFLEMHGHSHTNRHIVWKLLKKSVKLPYIISNFHGVLQSKKESEPFLYGDYNDYNVTKSLHIWTNHLEQIIPLVDIISWFHSVFSTLHSLSLRKIRCGGSSNEVNDAWPTQEAPHLIGASAALLLEYWRRVFHYISYSISKSTKDQD